MIHDIDSRLSKTSKLKRLVFIGVMFITVFTIPFSSAFATNDLNARYGKSFEKYSTFVVFDGGVPFYTGITVGVDLIIETTPTSNSVWKNTVSTIDKNGTLYPFSSSVHTGAVEYYKNGSFVSSNNPTKVCHILQPPTWKVRCSEKDMYQNIRDGSYSVKATGSWSGNAFPGSKVVHVNGNLN